MRISPVVTVDAVDRALGVGTSDPRSEMLETLPRGVSGIDRAKGVGGMLK